jgi:chromosome segregation ATPase
VLQDTETLCGDMLERLDALPVDALGGAVVEELKTRLQKVKASFAQSKTKVMVRTAKGNELSLQAKAVAEELAAALTELTATLEAAEVPQRVDAVRLRLSQLEREARKVEMYWKSYEAAIT